VKRVAKREPDDVRPADVARNEGGGEGAEEDSVKHADSRRHGFEVLNDSRVGRREDEGTRDTSA
jgi:hypothetical protein